MSRERQGFQLRHALTAVVACLFLLANAVLPQDSADRLSWWEARWQAQRLRQHDALRVRRQ